MNIEEPKITLKNLVNTIDRAVLNLKRVKKGEEFSIDFKNQLINIFSFTIDSKTDKFSTALFSKGVFIEKESLEILHKNLHGINISKEELEEIIPKIETLSNNNILEINKIQSILINISIPIWETTQQLANE
jgi:hypothetical protein